MRITLTIVVLITSLLMAAQFARPRAHLECIARGGLDSLAVTSAGIPRYWAVCGNGSVQIFGRKHA
ncbi:MAG: hypothetical protein ACREBN_02965 [Burkholderiaceae bacterium]